MTEKRKYQLKRRAERQQETRRRIVEAAVALHRTVGPARATISAVAERAGVDRHTVYSHFPDLRTLFEACSSYGREKYPWPDPTPWHSLRDPSKRLRAALAGVYDYYDGTEAIWTNVLRDAQVMPLLREFAADDLAYLGELRALLAAGWSVRGRARVRLEAAIGLAVDFRTWQMLARQEELKRDDAVELMVRSVTAAAEPSASQRRSR
jgi:AcrR family transcriptional regulator